MTYEQIAAVLHGLESRFGWQPMIEDGKIIGVQLDGQSVTLEPGGQFELSGAPVDTIHKTCAEVNSHLYQVCVVLLGACGVVWGARASVCHHPTLREWAGRLTTCSLNASMRVFISAPAWVEAGPTSGHAHASPLRG